MSSFFPPLYLLFTVVLLYFYFFIALYNVHTTQYTYWFPRLSPDGKTWVWPSLLPHHLHHHHNRKFRPKQASQPSPSGRSKFAKRAALSQRKKGWILHSCSWKTKHLYKVCLPFMVETSVADLNTIVFGSGSGRNILLSWKRFFPGPKTYIKNWIL